MIRIRLQRTGRKRNPTYRIVVADKARSAKGKVLEVIGHYLPAREEVVLEVDQERVKHWISKGAIPSNTMARILNNAVMKDMDKYMKTYTHKKKRKESDEPKEEAAAPKEEVKEEVKEEKKEEAPAEKPKEEEKKEEVKEEVEAEKEDDSDKEKKEA